MQHILTIRGALTVTAALVALLVMDLAYADRLRVPESAPAWAHAGAVALLILHIGGGATGLIAGLIAVATRKGGEWHRISGRVFFIAMFSSYLVAVFVAPFLAHGRWPNTIAGLLALYLLITGINAARRRVFVASHAERFGLAVALLITGVGIGFVYMSINSDTGTVDGSPPETFIVFILAGTAATVGEINVLVRGKLSPAQRQSRHLWRMCTSFFIASGSLFFGQPQVFPEWFNNSVLSTLLAIAPLLVLLYWSLRPWLTARLRSMVSG